MMDLYKYAPVARGSIRLLHIVSVSPEVILRVEHASLDDKPAYNALSYTWGPPTFTERAILEKNGERGYLNITPSLRHCLSHFGQYVGTNIWIDALCINQRDDAEKSSQVRQMDRVYDQASKVLMWLGPNDEDSDDAMRAMATYGKEAADAGILKLRKDDWSEWVDGGMTGGEDKEKDEAAEQGDNEVKDKETDDDMNRREELTVTMRLLVQLLERASEAAIDETRVGERFPRAAFARLTHRDYFTRVWIKQEVTLARDPIIHCGAHSAPLAHFHALVLFYGLLSIWEPSRYNAGLSNVVPMLLESDTYGGIVELDGKTLHIIHTPAANSAIGYHLSGRRKRQEEGPEPLYKLLHQSYVRGGDRPPLACFMPEDKIWGLAGIASDITELGLKANYGVDTADQVYENTARGLLRQGHVDMLKWCRPREGGIEPPSWVPNWRLPIYNPWSDDTGEPVFKPFTRTITDEDKAKLAASDRPGRIGMLGIKDDTVTDAGSPWHVEEEAKFSQVSFLKLAQELFGYLSASRYTEADSMEAIWRIPIGDKELFTEENPYYVRGTNRSRDQFHLIISRPWDSEMTKLTASYQACATRQFNARPIRTEKGWVGMGPEQVLVGDVVVLLVGGTTPFVLRPLELEGGEIGYLLVGECFVHGIMDGELNHSDDKLTVFELH